MQRTILGAFLAISIAAAVISFSQERNRKWVARLLGAGRFEQSIIRHAFALAQQRKQAGSYGRHALVLQSKGPARYVLLGDLNGNLASYERIKEALIKQHMLGADLQIVADNTYLVVIGGLGDPSPLTLLQELLLLIEKNPSNAFWIRGRYEDKGYWMRKELGSQVIDVNPYSDDFLRRLRTFFNTLPVALYLYPWGQNHAPIRIAWDGPEENGGLDCKLIEHREPIKAICTHGSLCSIPEPLLGAQIEANAYDVAWETMHGLQRVGDSHIWNLVSNPSGGMEQSIWLNYDAYAVLSLEKTLDSSTIELFSNRSGAFKPEGRFNLVSGKAV